MASRRDATIRVPSVAFDDFGGLSGSARGSRFSPSFSSNPSLHSVKVEGAGVRCIQKIPKGDFESGLIAAEAIRAYGITTGDEPEPQPLDIDYGDWKARKAQFASAIALTCSLQRYGYTKGFRSPSKCRRHFKPDLTPPQHTSVERPSSTSFVLPVPKKTNRSRHTLPDFTNTVNN
ncbi:hypothetical protein K440DRAFT_641534 [Wilcoxina mikolae CBS 423.85]|nr:hypothetical protein K440DRAFT_641534 [Wilcoxina mikolae CBS 423.85]